MRAAQLAILCIAAALAACSINVITYTPEEDCAITGDEDDNGMVHCDDPACADTPSCLPVCRNGRKERGEGCDDGNTVDGDGCDNNCMVTECGNGVMAGSEKCDDGNQVSGDGCDYNCTPNECGNNVMTTGEACDDGNTSNTDDCTNDCLSARCGDNFVHAGLEVCYDGNTTTEVCAYGLTSCVVCNATCHDAAGATSYCGDSNIDSAHESCDDGNAITEPCPYGSTSCTVCDSTCASVPGATSYCGNGNIDGAHESCDDGNTDNTDGCLNSCVVATPCTGGDTRSVDPATGACYMLYTMPKTYAEAQSVCHDLVPSASLASVQSGSENALIATLIATLIEPKVAFLGGTRVAGTNTFRWEDGTLIPLSLPFWKTGEPNNAGGVENCIEIFRSNTASDDGKWNDVPCAPTMGHSDPGKHAFVCERD